MLGLRENEINKPKLFFREGVRNAIPELYICIYTCEYKCVCVCVVFVSEKRSEEKNPIESVRTQKEPRKKVGKKVRGEKRR